LRGSYTWLTAEDRMTGLRLERRPEHRGSVRADYDVCRGFSAYVNALFTGARPDQDFSAFPSTRVQLPAYTKLDLGFNARLCKNFSLFGRVENLLDENYEEAFGFPALGRLFVIGGTARF
jgi:vitamin B12 transporter